MHQGDGPRRLNHLHVRVDPVFVEVQGHKPLPDAHGCELAFLRGGRSEETIVVTTLLDAILVRAEDLELGALHSSTEFTEGLLCNLVGLWPPVRGGGLGGGLGVSEVRGVDPNFVVDGLVELWSAVGGQVVIAV